ncbi:ABC transporter substrate-binding protein [Acidisphaera sp. L21]|uniref:ABC transporter substrate-binding protein n=1 Tax=Acidisphaera sp. L21 TaxID=1641851 RepID=UPI001C207BD7|nr:ABC transporter substrate-binding protein [Acidisphaera sp. L21]
MAISRRTLILASAGTLAMPYVARAADPIKIGMTVPITGPAAESGGFMTIGAKIGVEEVNEKGVLGRKVELHIEDDQTTNPGAVLAFSRMSGDPTMVAFIGSVRSTQVHAMAPDVLKIGKPMMIGGTDPALTHLGNRWLFRCRPNDSYSAKVIAQYGVETLAKKKWAIVHSTDAFGTGGMKALVESLKAAGIEPSLVQGYTNQQADFTPVALAVRQSGADVLGSYFTFETDLGVFARQLRQLGVRVPWIGSPSITNTSALNLAGASLYGTFGVADYAVDSSPAAKTFATKFEMQSKNPPDNQSSWAHDAVVVLGRALNDAGSTDPDKLRTAILAIRGLEGAEGTYNFDQNGDGLHGYNVVKNNSGKIVFDKHIDFQA